MKSKNWTRRSFLQAIPSVLAWSSFARGLNSHPHLVAPAPSFSKFVDVAASAGLTQTMYYGDPARATYIIEVTGGGCAFFDYDNDGWMDAFIVGGRRLEGVPPGASNRLYKNNRDGTFTDVTEKAGLLDAGWASGVCVGDYNNDGFEDLFLTYFGQNKLYRNNGDGTFTDVTAKAGLLAPHDRFSSGCTFIDYNRDGHLDLFVSNYVEFDLATAPRPSLDIPNCNYEGVPTNCGPNGLGFPQHYLYRSNGDGTFTDVSKEAGIAPLRGSYGLTAVTFDADEDGWPDIFVACDSTPSLLLMNNHDGTFREEGLLRGVALSDTGRELGGMGVGLGDYNLDGHLDIVKTHFQDQASGLYCNDGKADFVDATTLSGIGSERRFISWGTGMVDLDNDGFPDIFWVTGTVFPELEQHYARYPAHSPRILFRNQGNATFLELGQEAGLGVTAPHSSRGCAFGDFDNDGDLDILIMNKNEPPSLLRNDAPSGNHWLKVRLEGTRSNRSAIGARVIVRYAGKVQAQCVTSQTSYLSSNDPRLHFGLGKALKADVEIHWPAGTSESFKGVDADQLLTIREGEGIVKGRPFRKSGP
ncbi:MAG TPA: CRTAC1 family protein [Candidatus Acidoferrales bacterium]|nr:CRTAC1 family protein [Candidatus Acidoferrales bacterium]